ncbi:MAG: ribonuclease Z [bacterium ADurb.Bin478]|nr:MAG: ribonuclease Z [bacterium ADurb.Bin478]
MRIEILGCSGAVSRGYNTTSILVNDCVLIDAGSAASALNDKALHGLRHIFLTHTHIDHLKELPFILEPALADDSAGVTVWGSPETIAVLKDHVFNGAIWPDIQKIVEDENRLRFACIEDLVEVEGLTIAALPVDHIPGAVAYDLEQDGRHVLISGDTGFDSSLFEHAAGLGASLGAFFIEASFPNRLGALAEISKHLTPALIGRGLTAGLAPTCQLIAYHLKPKHLDEILSELPEGARAILGGEVFDF